MSRTTDIEHRTTARQRACRVAGRVNRNSIGTSSARARVSDVAVFPRDACDGGFVMPVDVGVTGQ